jgi:hypothetical protein
MYIIYIKIKKKYTSSQLVLGFSDKLTLSEPKNSSRISPVTIQNPESTYLSASKCLVSILKILKTLQDYY